MPPRLANFVFLLEIHLGFHHVIQAGLELLALSDPPALVFLTVGILGVSHHTWPIVHYYFYLQLI